MRLLSQKKVAKLLDVSPRQIRRWVSDGVFPAAIVLPGGVVRWHMSVVEAWAMARPASDPEKGVKKKNARTGGHRSGQERTFLDGGQVPPET